MGNLSKTITTRETRTLPNKSLMSKTIALHVRCKSLYISYVIPSLPRRRSEANVIPYKTTEWNDQVLRSLRNATDGGGLSFRISIWIWKLTLHIQPGQVFRAIGVINRSRNINNIRQTSWSSSTSSSSLPQIQIIYVKTASSINFSLRLSTSKGVFLELITSWSGKHLVWKTSHARFSL